MKTARFEFDELPFQTLARFGLTQEMIEDLPMRVLDELCEGRHSPVLPVRVSDENGKTVESAPAWSFTGWRTDRWTCSSILY